MTKKHFVALGDATRVMITNFPGRFTAQQESFVLQSLANFCAAQNPRFDRARWLAYIAGECGPNGGKAKGGQK